MQKLTRRSVTAVRHTSILLRPLAERPKPMKEKVIIAMTTCSEAAAGALAEALVSERLAACVNQIPGVESTYCWQGSIVRDREALLIIKTTHARYDALAARLEELHPYELPEFVTLPVESGMARYLDWVRAGTDPETEA